MAPRSLKDFVISTVQVFEKTQHPEILQRSGFDGWTLELYAPLVFFYEKPAQGQSDSSKLTNHLKESLSRTLVLYYPFAGRWVNNKDTGLKELQCSDEGVPFIEASIDEDLTSVMNLKDYEPQEVLGGFRLLGLDPTVTKPDVDFPLPPLFVQVTHFKCGGLALHVTFYHLTGDGLSMFTFMKAWSQIALHDQTTIVPSHDRSFSVEPEDNPISRTDHKNGRIIDFTDEGVTEAKLTDSDPMFRTILHVKTKVIQDLKRKASSNGMRVTTVELIVGHIWRAFSKASKSDDEKMRTLLMIVVNGRKKFHDPPLSEHYSGNCALPFLLPLEFPAPESESRTDSDLLAATIVHNTVDAVNPSTWKDLYGNLMRAAQSFWSEGEQMQVVPVTSLRWFPVYEIGFSPGFEKPVFVCSNDLTRDLHRCLVRILPPPPALAKDTIATLQFRLGKGVGVNEAVLSDQDFLSFFH